jgi:hypothetical protein
MAISPIPNFVDAWLPAALGPSLANIAISPVLLDW